MGILEISFKGNKDRGRDTTLSFVDGRYSHGSTSIPSSLGDGSNEEDYNPL